MPLRTPPLSVPLRSLALEVAADNIRVMTIAPRDEPGHQPFEQPATHGTPRHPPDAVGRTLTYLLNEGSFCTGQVMSPA